MDKDNKEVMTQIRTWLEQIQTTMIILKLFKLIDWSWGKVLMFTWIPIIIFLVLTVIVIVVRTVKKYRKLREEGDTDESR